MLVEEAVEGAALRADAGLEAIGERPFLVIVGIDQRETEPASLRAKQERKAASWRALMVAVGPSRSSAAVAMRNTMDISSSLGSTHISIPPLLCCPGPSLCVGASAVRGVASCNPNGLR